MELYKKLRPQKWEQLVGQESVARSLYNAVKSNKVGTAYIFIGERGTGKTSSAFILAKAVNCENLQSGNPCNECYSCKLIDSNSHLGVHYESMANNSGVENMRRIMSDAYRKTDAQRQVWILDEVHRLSREAWDALLIPLEDPAMPSLFILCSTEAGKIPETITSRAQTRSFRLVDHETMRSYLKRVAHAEQLNCSDKQIDEAVTRGGGSVRDTLTQLESMLMMMDTAEHTVRPIENILLSLQRREPALALQAVAEAEKTGLDGAKLMEQLFSTYRNLILLSNNVDKNLIGEIAHPNPKELLQSLYGEKGCFKLSASLGDTWSKAIFVSDQRILIETTLLNTISTLVNVDRKTHENTEKN